MIKGDVIGDQVGDTEIDDIVNPELDEAEYNELMLSLSGSDGEVEEEMNTAPFIE